MEYVYAAAEYEVSPGIAWHRTTVSAAVTQSSCSAAWN